MRDLIAVAASLAWVGLWILVIRAFGFPSMRGQKRAKTRELLMRMGRLQYILVYGVFGRGIAFALGMLASDLVKHTTAEWDRAVFTFVLEAVLFGASSGFFAWREAFRPEISTVV